MKKINTSTYTFEDIIKGNYLYVDKTAYFYKLVSEYKGQYFLSRPRRFGKSLAISTLDAIFRGKKELFKGLKIYDSDYDWVEYPVIRIDFARTNLTSQETLTLSLREFLFRIANEYDVEIEEAPPANMFETLIRKMNEKTGKGIVLLIDEYDKPLLDHMNSPEEAEGWRQYIDAFYQIIKGSEEALRFVFITGVTRFAKVSIFSKLNNITDITMNRDYAEMFGYTQDELEEYFSEYINDALDQGVSDILGEPLDREGLLAEIKRWYDGFRFSEYGENVYNPVSIGQFMDNFYEFNNYWFNTGTPTFLLRLLKKNGIIDTDLLNVVMPRAVFDTFDIAQLAGDKIPEERILQMLYQTGYLTIDHGFKGARGNALKLKMPNYEVESSLRNNIFMEYTGRDSETFGLKLYDRAMNGNTADMIELLQSYFASFPYNIQIPQEKYYQSMVRIMFEMSGMSFLTEEVTNIGRIDGVLEAGEHLYIIEFKLNKSADAAMEQIDDKKYSEKYIIPAKEKGLILHKLGINFSFDEKIRNITDWKEELN